ncbi:MAG: T9SS type A sorting domain-containing protein [Ignavibacteriales bacterium]|nr:T9SS type A sorting domain-containing protein [Ignavibacteriales bacterium]
MGYFPSNDTLGIADPFPNSSGDSWVDKTNGNYSAPLTFDNFDLWNVEGSGVSVLAENQDTEYDFQWIEMNRSGTEPEIKKGEVFAVAISHDGINLDEERIGFYASANSINPGWKFYKNGRFDPDQDAGWWVREYTWDFAVIVDLIGDSGPEITNITELPTTVSIKPRTVQATVIDTNATGGPHGVSEVLLKYIVNEQASYSEIMTTSADSLYEGIISNFGECDYIQYWIEATDVQGNVTKSKVYDHYIYCPQTSNLVVFDGQPVNGYPSSYYFGVGDFIDSTVYDFPHDVWAYGQLTEELLNNYGNVFEIVTDGPEYYHKELIRNWLDADSNRNYFLAGQEWLLEEGFGQPFQKGNFEYDILGIKDFYSDVSYTGLSGHKQSSKLFPVDSSMFGAVITEDFLANTPNDTLIYDPVNILGNINNWIDAFEPVNSENVDMYVETRGIFSTLIIDTLACAIHNITENGNKVVFLSFDPLSITSSPQNFWYGFSESSIQTQTLAWFDAQNITEVNEELPAPVKLELSQNYPNPFNPATAIKYSIHNSVIANGLKQSEESKWGNKLSGNDNFNVKLIVYDILGREVKTLVNEKQKPGNYEVIFNGMNLSSGIYFYKLSYGNFIQTKKMILLK